MLIAPEHLSVDTSESGERTVRIMIPEAKWNDFVEAQNRAFYRHIGV